MQKQFYVLALGEVLLRLSPMQNERIFISETFEKQLAGAEVNVVSGISLLGLKTGIISKIPNNDIGIFARNRIRFLGIDDEYIVYDNEKNARLGVYYYESGAYPRKPRIVYDRLNTSMYKINVNDFDNSLYNSTKCFHTTGITLALSSEIRKTTVEMMKLFKKHGAMISFDVNFRSNLWTGEDAKKHIEEILPYIDVFFCSEDTARLTFQKSGSVKEMMKSFAEEYEISVVASTQRIVHSPKSHTFGSIIYCKDKDCYYEEEPYRNIEVIDRIGSGDAYISGVLYGLLKYNGDCQKALVYGNAASAVKNTIPGDVQAYGLEELNDIIQEHNSKEKGLEMKR